MFGWDSPRVRATSMGVPSGVRFMYLPCSGDMICTIHEFIYPVLSSIYPVFIYLGTHVGSGMHAQ